MADDGNCELNVQYTSVIKNSTNNSKQNENLDNTKNCNYTGYINKDVNNNDDINNIENRPVNNNNSNNNISYRKHDTKNNKDRKNSDHCIDTVHQFSEPSCSGYIKPVKEVSSSKSENNDKKHYEDNNNTTATNNNNNIKNNISSNIDSTDNSDFEHDDIASSSNTNNTLKSRNHSNEHSTSDTDADEDDMVKNTVSSNDNIVKSNRIQVPDNYYKISMNELRSYENLLRIFVLASLKRVGVCVIENFLPEASANGIVEEIQKLHKNPTIFTCANNEDYRGDSTYWLGTNEDIEEQCHNVKYLETYLHRLVLSMVNHEKQRGNVLKITHKSRTQISCFERGEIGYKPHIDNPNNNGRLLSVTFYCNKDYFRLEDGGLVRFYLNNNTKFIELEPRFNTAVISWSDRRVIKEVLPSTSRNLYHLNSWFFGSSSESAKRQFLMN